MSPSQAFIEESFKPASGHAMLVLLEFAFSGGTLRYVNNTEAVTSNGDVYQPLWFELELPENTEERLPNIRILADNVDLELARHLREHEGDPPVITLSVVTTIDLNVIEYGPVTLTVKSSGNRDVATLEINAGVEDLLNRSALPVLYSPGVTPGVLFV